MLAGLVPALPAAASSDEAWSAFRAAVEKTCTERAKSVLLSPVAIVDAYGSESYGIAIVYGREPGGKGATPAPGLASVVCVYDKRTKKAELSGIIETNFSH